MSEAEKPEPQRGATVTLREITKETLVPILHLKVGPDQEKFVASNAVSIAQAHYSPEAWFRAIDADDVPVGFVLLHCDAEKPEYYLWRYMIDHRYQGRGFGETALRLIIEHVRTLPRAKELVLSFVDEKGSPEGFYQRLGFERTGEVDEGEHVMRLVL